LKETNFIREQHPAGGRPGAGKKGEPQGPLSNKENQLSEAIEAALDKKAQDAVVIELGEICSFTDYFLICTGTSTRHNQTIAEHIEETLKKQGVRPLHIEGHTEGEWILLDYVDFVVHIFSARAREFYDLERLWRAGKRRDAHEFVSPRAL
jgi:ribosome-associated protein